METSSALAGDVCPPGLRRGAVNIAGMRFGHLVALRPAPSVGGRSQCWVCHCDCGREIETTRKLLRQNCVRSCGCSRWPNRTHGRSGTPLYRTWDAMVRRCTDPKHPAFKRYSDRGIRVCERWRTFEHFAADMGDRPAGLTLDRIDNSKGYEPGNCRWATPRQQQWNTAVNRKLSFRGRELCIGEWATVLGMGKSTISERLRRGWSVARTLTEKVRRG